MKPLVQPADETTGVGVLSIWRVRRIVPSGVHIDTWKLIEESTVQWRADVGLVARMSVRDGWWQWGYALLVSTIGGGVVVSRLLNVPPLVVVSVAIIVVVGLNAAWSFPRDHLQRAAVRRVLRRYGVPTCVRCGYDLRPTPAAERCPECGEANLDDGSEGPS